MRHDILAGRRVLAFVGDIYEDLELWYPKLRLQEAGAQVVLAGQEAPKSTPAKTATLVSPMSRSRRSIASRLMACCCPVVSCLTSCVEIPRF